MKKYTCVRHSLNDDRPTGHRVDRVRGEPEPEVGGEADDVLGPITAAVLQDHAVCVIGIRAVAHHQDVLYLLRVELREEDAHLAAEGDGHLPQAVQEAPVGASWWVDD